MKVINNFLSKSDYTDLKNLFFSDYFPWFFHKNSCASDATSQFQFIHAFYGENKINSNFFVKVTNLFNENYQRPHGYNQEQRSIKFGFKY